jgi:hypothetical protein
MFRRFFVDCYQGFIGYYCWAKAFLGLYLLPRPKGEAMIILSYGALASNKDVCHTCSFNETTNIYL